jgi:hypothetical protein
MAYMSYRGPADVVFTFVDDSIEVLGLHVLFEQTHTASFFLAFNPDRPERGSCTDVKVTLPDGWVEYGPVTYRKFGTLVFSTRDEWGSSREQPSS